MQTALLILLVVLLFYFIKRDFKRGLTEGSFISIVNHTFRTPLTRIKWMSEKLEQEIPRKEQIEVSKDLANSVGRLLEIIDELAGIKDINNTSTYNLKAVSLREILEECLRKYSATLSEKHIILSLPTMNDLPLLSVDTKKITFVIQVILENAILYSKEGGSIKIQAQIKNSELVLSVSDSGIGLSWRDKRHIFDRFYRGERAKKMNTDGMGLGLYLSREIIRRHKGKIYATSRGKDKGTTFFIKLPRKS
jgi:two-component system sensor histidine kinase VicK